MPLLVLMGALAALALAGCKAKTPALATAAMDPGGKVLAKVNGTPITDTELSFWLQGPHGGMMSPEMRAKALNELIDAELFYQKGVELGLNKDPTYQKGIRELELRLEAAKRSEMMRRVYNQEILPKVNVTDDEVHQYYDAHAKQIGTELHLESIPFKDESQALKALQEIKNGETFDKVAKETFPPLPKEAKSAHKTPWDLGMVTWMRIPTEWLEPLYSLKPGEVSGVLISNRGGVRIFKLVERKTDTKPDMTNVNAVIRNRIHDAKANALETDYVRKLENAANIQRFTSNS